MDEPDKRESSAQGTIWSNVDSGTTYADPAFEDAINAHETRRGSSVVRDLAMTDRRWATRAAVSDTITATIKGLDLRYPTLPEEEERARLADAEGARCPTPSPELKGLQADCPSEAGAPLSRIPALLPDTSVDQRGRGSSGTVAPRSDG